MCIDVRGSQAYVVIIISMSSQSSYRNELTEG